MLAAGGGTEAAFSIPEHSWKQPATSPDCRKVPLSRQQLLARVARGTVTYLRLMSPLLEQRAAVSAVTPALLMELLWRLRQTGEGVRMGQSWHHR